MSIDRWSLDVGWLPAMRSSRPHRHKSPSFLSVGKVGLNGSPGVSVAGESPRTRPPQDQDIGHSCKQAVLASAAMAKALLGTVSLDPPTLSVAPELTGFMN